MSEEQYIAKKKHIIALCKRAKDSGLAHDAPFEIKQKTIKTVVDRIYLNLDRGWFKIDGTISGTFLLVNPKKPHFNSTHDPDCDGCVPIEGTPGCETSHKHKCNHKYKMISVIIGRLSLPQMMNTDKNIIQVN